MQNYILEDGDWSTNVYSINAELCEWAVYFKSIGQDIDIYKLPRMERERLCNNHTQGMVMFKRKNKLK